MQVTVETFKKWTKKLTKKLIDKDMIKQKLWMVSVRFDAMRYINGGRYLPRNMTLENEKVQKLTKNNVHF